MSKVVVFPEAGRRVELIKCFAEYLNDEDEIYVSSQYQNAPALYGRYQVFTSTFTNINEVPNPTIIIPTLDTQLKEFEDKNDNKYLVSKNASVWNNKIKTQALFAGLNLPVPQFIGTINEGKYSEVNVPDYSKQYIFKPVFGACSKNQFTAYNKKTYKAIIDLIFEMNQPYIIQEKITGYEYTIDCFADFNNNLIQAVQRRRDFVRAGEVSISTTVRYDVIEQYIKKLFKLIPFVGPITVQVFFNEFENKLYFIEINPRFGGGYPLSHRALKSYNSKTYPQLILNMFDGRKLKPELGRYKSNLTMTRYDKGIFVSQ